MIVDYLDGSAETDLETEVCVIGAGPAGLSIACALADRGVGVCILESGTWTGSETAQQLCAGESIGDLRLDPAMTRLRAFGGSLRLWGGGCMPLSPMDFTVRDWVPFSGWPIDYDSLAPYYDRARTIFSIDNPLARGAFGGVPVRPLPHFEDPAVVHRVSISSYGDPSTGQRQLLERAPHVHLVINATVVQCTPLSNGAAVDHVVIRALDGRRNVVRARYVVLACGGIENARLLLLSDSVTPGGLGNDYDQVGRWFMDHPSAHLGKIIGGDADHVTRPYEIHRSSGRTPRFAHICLSDEAQREHRVLNARVRAIPAEAAPPPGLAALRALRASRHALVVTEGEGIEQRICDALAHRTGNSEPKARTMSEPLWRLALRTGLGAGDLLHALTRKLNDHHTVAADHVDIVGFFEQAPNPASRVTLGDSRDSFGQRRVCVDWRLSPLDAHTYDVSSRLFGNALAQAAGGQFQAEAWLKEGGAPPMRSTAHHMGTTRMSDDRRYGVVDRHCRVHGVDNLYVAGSSVFPTVGWTFPTFTIAALSLRLAEQLSLRLAAERPLWVDTSPRASDADAQDHRPSSDGRGRAF